MSESADSTATGGPLSGRSLHFIAIGGAGMSGLALICDSLGAIVSGSDRAESSYLARLRHAGLEARVGHDAGLVPAGAEVVISTAISEDNPELRIARERGQRVIHRGELLAELTALRRLIAVAGAHGKTTTSGMIAHALRGAGADPAFILGGELPGGGAQGMPANAGWGAGEVVVAEADESDGSFLRLRPEVALVTNLELDHHSHWSGEAELREAFAGFCAGAGRVVRPAGPELEALGEGLTFAPPASQRRALEADFMVADVRAVAAGSEFTLEGPDGALEVRLGVPGLHNVANATAALAALHAAGAGNSLPPLAELAATLAGFPGMSRRLERKGERAGAVIYDDYAHHPTEVAASLAALRELPHRRLIAVFQPHLYSRTRALGPRFGRALAAADVIGLLDVYAAREQPVGELEGVSGLQVAREAASAAGGRRVLWLRDIDRAVQILGPELGEGDILVTIGAGDVFRLAERLSGSG